MSKFSVEFDYHGRRQSLDLHAVDWAKAERKLWMLKAHGEIGGCVVVEIPMGWAARFWAWVRGE